MGPLELLSKHRDLFLLSLNDLIFCADLLGLEEDLALADIGKLLGEKLALSDTVHEY